MNKPNPIQKPIQIHFEPTEQHPHGKMWTTKSSLWDWLKRERIFKDIERQVANAVGLTPLQKQEANRGRRQPPMRLNRAARRRMGSFTRIPV